MTLTSSEYPEIKHGMTKEELDKVIEVATKFPNRKFNRRDSNLLLLGVSSTGISTSGPQHRRSSPGPPLPPSTSTSTRPWRKSTRCLFRKR